MRETTGVTLSRCILEDTKKLSEKLGWQTVTKRRENKKPQEKQTKLDAIVIPTKDNTSYADILRRVKTDPKLCELEENVTKIRRAVKSDLLLLLYRPDVFAGVSHRCFVVFFHVDGGRN